MDLGAYVQINDLQKIADDNGIKIERCRGYRLMKHEVPVDEIDIVQNVNYVCLQAAEEEIRRKGSWIEYGWGTDKLCKKYLFRDKECDYMFKPSGIKWYKIHGKLRKRIKLAMKYAKANTIESYRLFNKYVGRNDVLYIHAKLGSTNWSNIHWSHYKNEPWFLDGCDDPMDPCYCDIYAKIKEVE